MKTLFLTAAAAVLLSGAAFAADAPAAQPAPSAQPAPNVTVLGESNSAQIAKDKSAIVCHTMPPETGTRMGARRICRTEAEWEKETGDAAAATRMLQQKATMGRPPGG